MTHHWLGYFPQALESYQEEEQLEKELLNRSLHERKSKKWNKPSNELPATRSQLDLIVVLAEESEASRRVLDSLDVEMLTREDAHELILEAKIARSKEELYG